MSKFKKVLLSVLLGVILCGGLALSICYIVIPQETKSAIDIVVSYLNTPIGLGCGCSITIGVILYVVGKALYHYFAKDIKSGLESAKAFASSKEQQAKDYLESANKTKEETKQVIAEFNDKLEVYKAQFKSLCDTIPNAKVKALGQEFSGKCEEVEKHCEEQLSSLEYNYNEIKEKGVSKYDTLIKDLTERLAKVEEKYEEREERVDSSSNEE